MNNNSEMNYKEPVVTGIFPTPIMFSRLDRPFSSEEIKFVDDCKLDVFNNYGNKVSNNTYVLYDPAMIAIRQFIEFYLDRWFKQIQQPLHNVKPYITQSWFTFTNKGGFHYKHVHTNSFVSGVFYFNADRLKDNISFDRSGEDQLLIQVKNYNNYNSKVWQYPISTGDLILFPSNLYHYVSNTESEHTRICLAFNVFVEGLLGDEIGLTALYHNKHERYDR
jgi:uncharacterized protein (TIGR02466 family)